MQDTSRGSKKPYTPSATVNERAKLLILNRKITLVPEQKCFCVTSLSGKKYTVTLFSPELEKAAQFCTCSSTTTCSHITAAMMSIGYVPRIASSKRNKKPNGTRMRKNEKKRAGSGLGKKKSARSCETKNQNKKKVKEMVFVLSYLYF